MRSLAVPAQLTAASAAVIVVVVMMAADSGSSEDVAVIGNTDLTSTESENNIINTVIISRLSRWQSCVAASVAPRQTFPRAGLELSEQLTNFALACRRFGSQSIFAFSLGC